MTTELLTRREAAEYLKTSMSTIDRWLREGYLAKVTLQGSVRIPRESIDLLVSENLTPACGPQRVAES